VTTPPGTTGAHGRPDVEPSHLGQLGAEARGQTAAVPSALVTDLYELTMAAAYQAEGVDHPATFELFVRSLPAARRFLLAAGLDDALAGLESWHFGEDDVEYLAGLGLFPTAFL
jgi:nicotinate phosphoribosyltransferase